MEIHIRFDESNDTDTSLTVLVNETDCGQLTMKTEDAFKIVDIFKAGCSQKSFDFESSGELYESESWVIWHKRSGKVRRTGQERREGQDRRTGKDRRD